MVATTVVSVMYNEGSVTKPIAKVEPVNLILRCPVLCFKTKSHKALFVVTIAPCSSCLFLAAILLIPFVSPKQAMLPSVVPNN